MNNPKPACLGYVVAIGLLVPVLLPGTSRGAECSRRPLQGAQPRWISSAAFITSLNKIALVDPLRNELLLVDRQGKSQDYKGDDLGVPTAAMTPAIVNSSPEGFEISMVDQQLHWYDSKLKPVKSQNLTKVSASSRGKIMGTYSSILAGDDFFSVGAVKLDGKLHLGFFRVPVTDPSKFEFLADIPAPDYYVLGHQYIASLKETDYALLMSKHPVILEFPRQGRMRSFEIFPRTDTKYDIDTLKSEAAGNSSDEVMYKEIEGLSLPVGLYGGKDGFLYLLTREPENGATTWRLFQIDPAQRKILGEPMRLPTTTNHLSVVVGSASWYFLEKGPVLSSGSQEIKSMFEISNSAISKRAIPAQCR